MNRQFTPKNFRLIFIFVLSFNRIFSQVPNIEFQPVLENKIDVVDLVHAGDGSNRVFLVHRGGNIQVYSQSFTYIAEFLSVSGVNTSGVERGLLSLAFHPDYETNGYFFVYYSGGPNGDLTLARYKRSSTDPNQADPNSRVILLSIPKPITFSPPFEPDKSHNGGKLNFGPDGYLYFATGDGGSGYDVYGNAENGSSLLGKMIRININSEIPPYYTIPPDNPYVNNPNVLDEIWALGLRNPWRWTFDRLTNDIWLADVGQRDREEVSFVQLSNSAGKSFGWHCFEGSVPTPTVPPCTSQNYVPPVFDYSHNSSGGQAVVGGFVYRGTEYPTLNGYYICGDFSSKNAWLIKRIEATNFLEVHPLPQALPSSIFTFGEAENGTLYISGNDGIFKVAVSSALPVKLVSFTLTKGSNYNLVKWKTTEESNLKEFALEFSFNGINFHEAGRLPSSGKGNGATYSINHSVPNNERIFYRLQLIDNDGALTYSKVISTITQNQHDPLRIYPTVSSGQRIQVELNEAFQIVQVYNVYGQLIQRLDPGGTTGIVYLDVRYWKKGNYILIAKNNQKQENRTFTVQ